ncbi:hypothetical protein M7I_6630 [Glarea lozoyensis 74030]|uniref:Uncharacterized protein n=1 Tax=Glarea lozoyensis (strain ATCC 74030 / MF5533) TaxID=1104152 RepID=H0EV37_GLAL7|nr:hypothetical protein M7I_6630 [Glarea lozoyensis 74030]
MAFNGGVEGFSSYATPALTSAPPLKNMYVHQLDIDNSGIWLLSTMSAA